MKEKETRSLLTVLYVLSLLLLGAIYFQSDLMADPNSVATLQQMQQPAIAGTQSIELITHFKMSAESALTIIISMTLFFGFAWGMTRSRSI